MRRYNQSTRTKVFDKAPSSKYSKLNRDHKAQK